jgi:hypothetical protein
LPQSVQSELICRSASGGRCSSTAWPLGDTLANSQRDAISATQFTVDGEIAWLARAKPIAAGLVQIARHDPGWGKTCLSTSKSLNYRYPPGQPQKPHCSKSSKRFISSGDALTATCFEPTGRRRSARDRRHRSRVMAPVPGSSWACRPLCATVVIASTPLLLCGRSRSRRPGHRPTRARRQRCPPIRNESRSRAVALGRRGWNAKCALHSFPPSPVS